ncbi:glycosyltransferase involved in cell wall biosynthesis [Thermocatellispora tengchongensis]|uniref:Glycosyltransferase involved in cell wall biosynthesis n=1 Tax=Thermocatellispora tengchongensis TaxID=1073253 RepID=A0A840P8V2_9ACTN|nr:glycosyltransferase [Thermocatellispora tengchongensis]MBB5136098.1 glycosyltransferase involved in cell wall biosynthesis [Thermocatellispora tengchongensis]
MTIACSVVIPTYNRAELLAHTLRSLTRQTLPAGRFEVLVSDDGSGDDTADVVRSFADRLDLRYFYQEDEGYRLAKARNVGIRHARGEVCVMVDSGVLLSSGCLEAHLAAHAAWPGPVAAIGYVYCFNEDNEDAAQMRRVIDVHDPDATIALLRDRGQWLDIREEFYARYTDEFHDLPAPWLVYWCCNVSAPTGLLREIGGFDEWFVRWGGEDVELAYRLHRAGARFVLSRDAASIHYPHPKVFKDNIANAVINYKYIAEKYGTPITRLLVDNHFFVINDIIRERGLPSCEEYLAGRAVEHA